MDMLATKSVCIWSYDSLNLYRTCGKSLSCTDLHYYFRIHMLHSTLYALYKIVLNFRKLVSQDTPSFLSLLLEECVASIVPETKNLLDPPLGCVLTFIVGNSLSLYLTLTAVLLNEQKKINKLTKN